MSTECIDKSAIETETQVVERCSETAECYLLLTSCCVPETLKCLCHVVVFTVKLEQHLSPGMVAYPAVQNLIQALLEALPGQLISPHRSTTEQLHTVLLL